MTHSPPIPPANQTPFPLSEPPHVHPVEVIPAARSVANDPRDLAPVLVIGAIAVAAMAGIAALFYARRTPEPAPAPPAKRPTRTPAARKKPATSKSPPPKPPAKRKPRASADDKANRGPQDASRIAMSEDYEVRYWTRKFGVDRDALQRAVDAVGTGAKAVEQELQKS